MPEFAHIFRGFCAISLFLLLATGSLYGQTGDFISSSTLGCAPYTVSFIDQSSPAPISWKWDFGDGNTSTSKDPTNVYVSPGVYTVSLEVDFAGGGKVTVTKTNYMTVNSKPTANFTATNTSGCEDLKVNFTSSSTQGTGKIVDYFYEFGNSFYDTIPSPSHIYRTPGTYDVKLVVTDTFGCTHFKEVKNMVTVLPGPAADFGSSTNNGCAAPHVVTFINTTINNAAGNANFWWSFGNSQTATSKNPSMTYTATGTYDVQLVAENSLGCRDTIKKTAFVNIQSVKANFTNSNAVGCAPLSVSFTNTSTPVLPNNSFYWSFGNGAHSNAKDTSYQYFGQGQYSVKLVMTAANGCKDSINKVNLVQLQPKPDAGFYVNDTTACRVPQGLFFFAKSSTATSYAWDFGDGTTSTQKNPSKVYTDTGRFTVKLKVTGANGCTDSFQALRLIRLGPPRADFEPSILEGCAPLKVSFSNTSSTYAPITSVSYKFGDGGTSNQGFPNYTYQDTGLFLPWIYVTTDDGCTDSIYYDTIGVGMQPAADFYIDSTIGCRNQLKVKFTSTTNQGTIKADYFEWFPGAGLKLKGEVAEMVYKAESRIYDILLVAYHHGCPDSMEKKNMVTVLDPTAKFQNFSAGCNDDSIFFKNVSVGGTEFHWDFGDGDTAFSDTATDQAHIYFPGIWQPRLIVYDSNTGCRDTAVADILVESSDVLKFRSDTAKCTQEATWFFDQTPGSSGWLWTIGETRICTTRNCVIMFDQPGWYDVRFSAIVSGCRYTTIKKNQVHIYGPGFQYLTDTVPICAPELRDVITLVPSERPLTEKRLRVYYGANQLAEVQNFPDTLPYHFAEPTPNQDRGYIFQYWAKDSSGCTNFGADTFKPYRPEMVLTQMREPACQGDLHLFEADIVDYTAMMPLSYRFEFGDGYSETNDSLSARHTYMSDSLFPMKLITFDSKGCSDTIHYPMNIDVRNIRAAFSAPDTFKQCPPFLVSFNDESQNTYNGIREWKWTLGDGKLGYAQEPKKIYVEPGVYDISLRVTDSLGCTDSVFKQSYIRLDGTKIEFEIDTNYGCEPLTVHINSSAQGNADIRWSMNDGSPIVEDANFSHKYLDAGRFVPVVFIKDDAGCQYVVQIEDTIEVAKTPEPDFSTPVACIGQPHNLTNQTLTFGDTVSYMWYLTETDSVSTFDATHQYPEEGEYTVRLKATTTKKCVVDTFKTVWVSDPQGKLKVSKLKACAQEPLAFKLENTGHGAVSSIQWIMRDGNVIGNADSLFSYLYSKKGYYQPQLIYANEYGCLDTVTLQDTIMIGDNFAPIASPIYRTTVDDNFGTSTFIKPSTTIDFDKYIFYRLNPTTGLFDSIAQHLQPGDTIFTDKVPTLDATYTYRVVTKNYCGYYSDPQAVAAHRTIELEAFTADDASYLSWTPYAGWQPHTYEVWRSSTEDTSFVMHKQVPGTALNTYDSAIMCNVGYYYRIKAIGQEKEYFSFSDTSGAIPNYLPYVPANELLSASIEGPGKNLVEWTFAPTGKAPVKEYILERSRDGVDYQEAGRFDDLSHYAYDPVDSASVRWFYYRTIVEDICGYRSEPSNYGKTVILNAVIDTSDRPKLAWTAYEYWAEGVDYYDIEIYRNGGWQFLATVDGATYSWVDEISELNAAPDYCYRVTARSAEDGGKLSHSNIACAPVKSRIYVPNAFHPKGRMENRSFYPKGLYVSEFEMKIYDRWGSLIYTCHSMDDGWDGTFNGEPAPVGVYIYKIEYRGVDKEFEQLQGSFVLIR